MPREPDYTATNAAERAAFANGQQAMQAEIDRQRAALQVALAILDGSKRYKVRAARAILRAALDRT